MLREINYKVLSYCEVPQELTDGWLEEQYCDSYVTYRLENPGENDVDDWIRENYPELINIEFMVHVDY